jgi:predicted anti-sigma-YlaC factor YlaD
LPPAEAEVCAIVGLASGELTGIGNSMEKIDRILGRFLTRLWAILAFIAAAASYVFCAFVVLTAPIPGVLIFLLGILFSWLGLRAWRDQAGLGELLNREYEHNTQSKLVSNNSGGQTSDKNEKQD